MTSSTEALDSGMAETRKSNPMPSADLASRPTPLERREALLELIGLVMKDREERDIVDTLKPPPGDWSTKKWIVLLSDDDRVRDQVSRILEGEGYYVRHFSLGQDAFSSMSAAWYLEDEKIPDAMMLDLYMLEREALEFYRHMRSNPAWKDVPPIFLVRGNDEMVAVPFVFSVSEPIDRVRLLELVQRETSR